MVSSFSKFVFLPFKTALYISLPQPSLAPEKSGLIHFGKIFNNQGFLNNFQFHQEVIQPECPSPQEFQLVKVLLKHVSTEKCRRQLSMPNKKAEEVSRLRKSSSGWLFGCQPFQACHSGCRGAHWGHNGEVQLRAERGTLLWGPGNMCSPTEHS